MPLSKEKALGFIQTNELQSMMFIEIEELCGVPDYADSEEWIYFLGTSLFGIFSQKLHLFFLEGRVVGYSIYRYTLNSYVKPESKD